MVYPQSISGLPSNARRGSMLLFCFTGFCIKPDARKPANVLMLSVSGANHTLNVQASHHINYPDQPKEYTQRALGSQHGCIPNTAIPCQPIFFAPFTSSSHLLLHGTACMLLLRPSRSQPAQQTPALSQCVSMAHWPPSCSCA